MKRWRVLACGLCAALLVLGWVAPAWAFCGFYVSKADTTLFNKASQVAIARDGQRTVITMANDVSGDIKDFAVVVPVPMVLKQEQVHVGDPKVLKRLDAFSAPRLVEYFDANPCQPPMLYDRIMPTAPAAQESFGAAKARSSNALGVTVEAQFSVGEYDIVVLGAKESNGLETWLVQNGYKIPRGAAPLFRPYIRQNMKFFVAKVNLKEFNKAGFEFLRPIQMAYESPKFMLPIRLGMINAGTAQDLVVYILSPKGQAEVVNYRTVNVPSDANVPLFVKSEFGKVYPALFETAYNREGRNVVFREYAWNMGNCDPCSADPLTPEELRQAGVFWMDELSQPQPRPGGRFAPPWMSNTVFITRLHARYTRDKFPEDLVFQETANQQNFQGRYVLTHPYKGEMSCSAGKQYARSLPARFEKEAQTLANLTGWNISDIRKKMNLEQPIPVQWWKKLWNSLFDRYFA
ncbi:DUF2330 domain-containing protein [Altericista sp. CCNU0014]|uniref:DUF2330 domain-containing protein n=1 Tax=Altericista sp. CCNU0014 TaxID=3082949 RepID=UPI00384B0BF6